MTHPLQRWPRTHRRTWLIVAAIVAVVPMVLGAVTKPLGDEDIIAFELAGSVDRVNEILAGWEADDVVGVAKAMQIADLVYPFIYALALAGACVAAAGAWARVHGDRLAAAGIAMAWVATSAIVFDYIENLGLAVSLWGTPASPWPEISYVAGTLKFTAVYLSLAYLLTWPFAVVRRHRAATANA